MSITQIAEAGCILGCFDGDVFKSNVLGVFVADFPMQVMMW